MRLRSLFFNLFVISFFTCTYAFGQLDSTNLPIFLINTNGEFIEDEPKVNVGLKIIYQNNRYNQVDDSANVYDGTVGIEIRGRYSASLPQKPYGFETRDSLGNNLNVPLFHMPEENDWILLANYNDKTFMRNTLAFELFRKMGHYAPRTQFCEVLINGFYQGIYVFTEKIKQDDNRVAISDLNPDENHGDDLTGGYIFKVDYYDSDNSWKSSFSPINQPEEDVFFVYEYPKPGEISSIQKSYLQNYIQTFEQTLYAPATTERQRALSDLMDINSFIDYFILNELARNVDGYKKSSFFHKDKDSKGGLIHAGPVWDFDWAWKNINECIFGATDGSGWAYQVHQCNPWPVPPTWMVRLLQDPAFAQRANKRYFELRNSILSEASLFNYIDSVATLLDNPQSRHYQRWQILGKNVGAPEVDEQPNTYAGEVDKFKGWISKRLSWLDANMPSFVVTGIEEQIANAPCKIYPNPTTSHLTLQFTKSIKAYQVYAIDGRSVISEIGNDDLSYTLETENLNPGLYTIRSLFTDGSQWTGKFIKSN